MKTWPALDADSAFEVQYIAVEEAVRQGDRLVRHKLGNIAKVMQDAFGVDEPDYGVLFARTFIYESAPVALKNYIKPYVELEPAFVLKGSWRGPNVTVIDVINAVDYAIPAIEIIDSSDLGHWPCRYFGRQRIHWWSDFGWHHSTAYRPQPTGYPRHSPL